MKQAIYEAWPIWLSEGKAQKLACIPVKVDKSRELTHSFFFFFTTAKQYFSIVISSNEVPDEKISFLLALHEKLNSCTLDNTSKQRP